jgi:hypothetical protein
LVRNERSASSELSASRSEPATVGTFDSSSGGRS